MKNVLITGGHGFIGHHLARVFKDNGYRVTVIDNYKFRSEDNKDEYDQVLEKRLEHIGEHHFIQCAVEDFKFTEAYDLTLHLGGYPRQHETQLNIKDAIQTTWDGLNNLIRNKDKVGRLVYFSTSMVYGDFSEQTTEDAHCNPKSTYGTLRLLGETVLSNVFNDLLIIRPSAVYGPRDSSIRVVGKMIKDARNKGEIKVNGSQTELDFTYVDDVANGVYELVKRDRAGVYNVTYSAKTPYTLLDLANLIKSELGESVSIIELSHDNQFPKRSTLSIDKLTGSTGYVPRVMLQEGVKRVISDLGVSHDTLS